MELSGLKLIFVSLSVLLFLGPRLWIWRKHRKQATAWGCGRLPTVPWNDPLGLVRFWQLLAARSDYRVLPWMAEIMNSAGPEVHTAKDKIFGRRLIWTRDLENSRAVLSSQASDFDVAVARQQCLLPVIGSGVFTRTGHAWRDSRIFIRSQLIHDQALRIQLFEKHVQLMLTSIGPSERGWSSEFDIQPKVLSLTTNLFTEFIFGKQAESQVDQAIDKVDQQALQHHWDDAQTYFSMRALLGRYCWLYNPRKFRDHCAAIQTYADHYVSAAIARKEGCMLREQFDGKAPPAVIDELAKLTSDTSRLREECLNLFGAGRTSTAALISWVIYFLSRNSRVVEKLRKILVKEFGTLEDPQEITYESLKRCQYLRHCIYETFRLAPVNPVTVRVAIRDTTLPTGGGPQGKGPIFVPRGMEVHQNFYLICNRSDVWGADIPIFRPERFEDRKLSSEWMPFGMGPRICLGRMCSDVTCNHV